MRKIDLFIEIKNYINKTFIYLYMKKKKKQFEDGGFEESKEMEEEDYDEDFNLEDFNQEDSNLKVSNQEDCNETKYFSEELKYTDEDVRNYYYRKISKIKELEKTKKIKERVVKVKEKKEDKKDTEDKEDNEDTEDKESDKLTTIKLCEILKISTTNPEFLKYVSHKEVGSFAYYKKLVTLKDLSGSYLTKITTIKRYLHTLIDDEALKNEIHNFVTVNSKLYSAGSFIINSFILWMFQGNYINDSFIKDLLEQTTMKYIIIPFKSEISNTKNSKGCKFEKFNEFWNIYRDYFMEFYPSIEDLRRYYSDQILNNIAKTLKTNFKVHVLKHFTNYLSKYIIELIKDKFEYTESQIQINETTYKTLKNENDYHIIKYKLYDFIEKANKSKYSKDIPKELKKFITTQKKTVELKSIKYNDTMENEDEDEKEEKESKLRVHITVFKKFYEMSKYFEKKKKIKSFSMFPIYTIGRRHIMIDQKVVDKVFKKFEKPLLELFNLTDDKWNAINRLIRKIKRQKNKKSRSRIGSLPIKRVIKSISTDGVSISIKCHIEPIDYLKLHSEYKFTGKEKIIGFDDGRVNLYQSAEYNEITDKYETTRLTANKYQEKTLIIRNRDAILTHQTEAITNVIQLMATKSWRTMSLNGFFEMLNIVRANINLLTNHYINSIYYAKWKILLWRKKKSVMSKNYVHTINKCNNEKCKDKKCKICKKARNEKSNEVIVIALGDAKFSNTGEKNLEKERHGGVPTNSKHKVLIRVLKSMRKKFRILNIDEYNTSKMCYKCECKLKDIKDESGNIIRGLKECTTCTPYKNSFKVRNRDLNAAINILKIGITKIRGLSRPSYLERPIT